MEKRLALRKDGGFSYCSSSEETIGKGRCNHIAHQKDDESQYEFMKRCNSKIEEINKRINALCPNFKKEINSEDNSSILGGSQPKTVTKENKYFKFDREERDESGRVVMKYSYPSIAEAISSCLIRHSNIGTRVRCADYYFCTFEEDGKTRTASVSDSYILENEKEILFASNYDKTDNTLMSGIDYREEILEKLKPRDKIIEVLCEKAGMEKETAIQQFTDKCAIDTILRNNDVSNNPMNFVLVADRTKTGSNIVSMDYGRCLSSSKTNTYSADFTNFKQFRINVEAFKEEASLIRKKANSVSKELGIYTDCVIDNCLESLNENSNLWRNDYENFNEAVS